MMCMARGLPEADSEDPSSRSWAAPRRANPPPRLLPSICAGPAGRPRCSFPRPPFDESPRPSVRLYSDSSMRTFIAITLLMMAVALPAAVPTLPPTTAQALDALTAAERTFAKTARVKGWRAAFLEFFSPDAIALAPDPTSAVARLKIQPVRPFAEEELTWEPRAGDVAVSGALGWLTGPSIFIDHTAQNPSPNYGNYLSVWKKATDGSWRVFIDVGTRASSPVSFPSWFTHVTAVPRYRGTELPSQSAARLLDADRELNSALSSSAVA